MPGGLSAHQRYWRYRIFAVTWLAYAGFYLCRKNLSVVMPMLTSELGYEKSQLAWVISGFSIMYMLGQFLNGPLSDRFGPRLVVGVGLFIAAGSNLAMGVAAGALVLFGFLNLANGFGQSTGWPGTVKNMAAWFSRRERGVVMAWWGTCYVAGGVIATAFATYAATTRAFFPVVDWRRGFFAPALVLFSIALAYVFFTRNTPGDAGVAEIEPALPPDGEHAEDLRRGARRSWLVVLSSSAVWTTGAMYFFLKFTRYAFMWWLPLFMTEALRYTESESGYTSMVYEAAGFGGMLLAGYASDRLFGARRFPVACLMLLGLAAACLFYPHLSGIGRWGNILGIGLIGIMTYGPDSLLTGAAAMDLGSREAAGTAVGFINGMGSIGSALSPLAVAWVSDSRYGWDGVFHLFVAFALISAALTATRWNYGRGGN